MTDIREPIQDIAHLGHVELYTPKPEESLNFFTNVLGMTETTRSGQSVYLRGWGDYERHTLKLTESDQAGVAHIGWRCVSPQALERRAGAVEAAGLSRGWIEGDEGHGKAHQFEDPDGHLHEVYYDTEWYEPAPEHRSRFRNQPQRYSGQGIGVRRIDHVNVFASEVTPSREFMTDRLGFNLREHIILDDGKEAGAWLSVTPLVHDIAYTFDSTGTRGRLHHLAYWLDTREELLRAADLFVENDVFIETGPSKHAITQGFFLYVYEPGGNRIELFSGGYLIFAPDWRTVRWTQAERARGQAWGLKVPKTFHTYGTPVVDLDKVNIEEVPLFDPL